MTTHLLSQRAQELGFLLAKNQTEYSELQRGRNALQKGLALQSNLEKKLAELRASITALRTNLSRIEASLTRQKAQSTTQRSAQNKADAEWASNLYKKAAAPVRTTFPENHFEGLWGVDSEDFDGGVYDVYSLGALPEWVPMGKPGVEFQVATHPNTGDNYCVHHDGLLTYLSGEVIGYDPQWADSFNRPETTPYRPMRGLNELF